MRDDSRLRAIKVETDLSNDWGRLGSALKAIGIALKENKSPLIQVRSIRVDLFSVEFEVDVPRSVQDVEFGTWLLDAGKRLAAVINLSDKDLGFAKPDDHGARVVMIGYPTVRRREDSGERLLDANHFLRGQRSGIDAAASWMLRMGFLPNTTVGMRQDLLKRLEPGFQAEAPAEEKAPIEGPSRGDPSFKWSEK